MKDEITIEKTDGHSQIVAKIDDWVHYYNKDRYQWNLAKLSPNEYWNYIKTGEYPLTHSNLNKDEEEYIGGSAPEPPRVNALIFQEDNKRKDD